MHRRTLLCGLAAHAALLVNKASAQSMVRRKIGLLAVSTPDTPRWHSTIMQALSQVGYNHDAIHAELKVGTGITELTALAKELVDLQVDVIVTHLTPAALAARDATQKIPIVMAASADPVAMGLVQSLARPGGNITGISGTNIENTGKTIQILVECLPAMKRLAVLANESDPYSRIFVHQSGIACNALGIEHLVFWPSDIANIGNVLARSRAKGAEAIILQPSLPRREAASTALSMNLPMVCAISSFAREGGLLSYAPNSEALWRRSAAFVDRVLQGSLPADMPVEQPTEFELVVNLATARALKIDIPQIVLARASFTIE